jgi:hypothetical protein
MNEVTFQATSPTGTPVTVGLVGNAEYSRHGGTSASASSGGGGWQNVDRYGQKAGTEWLDTYPMVMTISCILDGGMPAQSVEPQITILEGYELPVPGSAPPLPPLITVTGPVAHNELTWVCSRLTMTGGEEGAMRDPTLERTQQTFSIELTEYVPTTVTIAGLSPAEQVRAAS